jgi:hypothetical protein
MLYLRTDGHRHEIERGMTGSLLDMIQPYPDLSGGFRFFEL